MPGKSDSSSSATAEYNIASPRPAFLPAFNALVVMAVVSMLRRANGAQAGIQRLHDQALVGAAFRQDTRCSNLAEKSGSQGNVCQGNGKSRFADDSPDNHSPDCSPAFSILHSPSSNFALVAAFRAVPFAPFCGYLLGAMCRSCHGLLSMLSSLPFIILQL